MSPILGIWASQISGRLWEPQGAYDALATVTPSGSTGTITFAGIPSTYKHLQIRAIGRSDYAGSNVQLAMRFNSDTAANYSTHNLIGVGSGSGTATGTVTLATSHASIHVWDAANPPMFQFDLYSCSDFSAKEVLGEIDNWFGLESAYWMMIDRNKDTFFELGSGKWLKA